MGKISHNWPLFSLQYNSRKQIRSLLASYINRHKIYYFTITKFILVGEIPIIYMWPDIKLKKIIIISQTTNVMTD